MLTSLSPPWSGTSSTLCVPHPPETLSFCLLLAYVIHVRVRPRQPKQGDQPSRCAQDTGPPVLHLRSIPPGLLCPAGAYSPFHTQFRISLLQQGIPGGVSPPTTPRRLCTPPWSRSAAWTSFHHVRIVCAAENPPVCFLSVCGPHQGSLFSL